MTSKLNRTVLMSGVDYFSDAQAINPFMNDAVRIDLAKAAREHQSILQAFESAGIEVVKVPPPKDCQDGVYTANWALIRGEKAVMSRLPGPRKGEEPYAAEVLKKLGKEIITLPEGLKWSGQGDSLPCGDLLFCGQGYRSDEAAQKFVADTLGFKRIQLQTIPLQDSDGNPIDNAITGWPDSYFYDIDLAISILRGPNEDKKALIAWCPGAFLPESQELMRGLDEIDKIEVSEQEAKQAFACNLVSTGQTVILNAEAKELTANIQAKGLKTIGLSNRELAKGGGSIRCTSLTLENN